MRTCNHTTLPELANQTYKHRLMHLPMNVAGMPEMRGALRVTIPNMATKPSLSMQEVRNRTCKDYLSMLAGK